MSNDEFINGMIDYVKTSMSYESYDKEQAMREVLNVLFGDIGAAQNFLYALGVKVDLYEMSE